MFRRTQCHCPPPHNWSHCVSHTKSLLSKPLSAPGPDTVNCQLRFRGKSGQRPAGSREWVPGGWRWCSRGVGAVGGMSTSVNVLVVSLRASGLVSATRPVQSVRWPGAHRPAGRGTVSGWEQAGLIHRVVDKVLACGYRGLGSIPGRPSCAKPCHCDTPPLLGGWRTPGHDIVSPIPGQYRALEVFQLAYLSALHCALNCTVV
jgi:hypothetical protein